MEIIIVMCVWIVAVITFFLAVYYLFFVKWARLQDRTKEKHNKI